MRAIIIAIAAITISGCALQKRNAEPQRQIRILKTETQARGDTKNVLEDIKIFRYYEEGTNQILKNPFASIMKFTKAIQLLEKKPLKYWMKSPYKSFTYQQLLITIKFWRVCAVVSIKGYGKSFHYIDHKGKKVDPSDNMDWIIERDGDKYLHSQGIDVMGTIQAMKK